MAVPRSLKLAAIVAIAAIVFFLFIGPAFEQQVSGFRTRVIVGTPEGEKIIYQDAFSVFEPQAIIKISGMTIDYFRWETDFQATSGDYEKYELIQPAYIHLDLYYLDAADMPQQCDANFRGKTVSSSSEFSTGQWYDLAEVISSADFPSTFNVSAAEVIGFYDLNGCVSPVGSYEIRYTISLSVQAVGVGALPTDSLLNVYTTSFIITSGSINVIEDTTSGSG